MGKELYNGYIYIHTYIGAWDCFFFHLFSSSLFSFLLITAFWNFFGKRRKKLMRRIGMMEYYGYELI